MDILAAIKREERKLEKELGKLQRQLSGVQAAAKAHVYDVGRWIQRHRGSCCHLARGERPLYAGMEPLRPIARGT